MSTLFFRGFLLVIFISSAMHVFAQDTVEINCPDHITINCEDELKELSTYGTASYNINGEIHDLENQQAKKNIDDCGKGNIERIWRYKSESGDEYKCSQFIYIGQSNDGKPLITWPRKEVIVSWCDPSYKPSDLASGAQRPEYAKVPCNKMEENYSDEIIYLTNGCKEVHRTWVVHDWCYDSKNVVGNDGHYKYVQVIKFAVPEEVNYGELEDIYAEAKDCEKVYVELPDMVANIEECNRRVRIKNDSPFSQSNGKNASGTYPVGETIVTYSVELTCTESRVFKQRILVDDPCREQAIIETKELNRKLERSFVRPNPFSQTTEIYFNNVDQPNAELIVLNTKGEQILTKSISLDENSMNSFKLVTQEINSPGVYLYNIQIGERNLEGKLIKIR